MLVAMIILINGKSIPFKGINLGSNPNILKNAKTTSVLVRKVLKLCSSENKVQRKLARLMLFD